jgi:spoIIIJ-associated protein
MENWESFIRKLIESLGFSDYSVEVDEEHRRGTIFIHEDPILIKENLPTLVESVNHLLQLVARKENRDPLFVDINNYRRERENLIIELVRATTRKVIMTRQDIALPAMNSYERRLAHLELASHPEVTTESFGKGHNRYVVVKLIQSSAGAPASAAAPIEPTERREPTSFEKIIEDIQREA